ALLLRLATLLLLLAGLVVLRRVLILRGRRTCRALLARLAGGLAALTILLHLARLRRLRGRVVAGRRWRSLTFLRFRLRRATAGARRLAGLRLHLLRR